MVIFMLGELHLNKRNKALRQYLFYTNQYSHNLKKNCIKESIRQKYLEPTKAIFQYT